MGRELAERHPEARAVFEEADDALGFALSRLCFEGPADDLRRTENTQPAILTVSTATEAVLRRRCVRPDYVAGHSLGEYSALVAAGALAFSDAVRLVRTRGRRMQEAVPDGTGAMAALLGLDTSKVESVCRAAAEGQVVAPANWNSPSQVVIAGHAAAVRRAVDEAKRAGARRAVMLPVSAPFHCALMKPARDEMAPLLDEAQFLDLDIPLINNWQASEVRSGQQARESLKQQIPNPVLWHRTIQVLEGKGVRAFVEVGPGRVLTGLLRGINRALRGRSTHNAASLEAACR